MTEVPMITNAEAKPSTLRRLFSYALIFRYRLAFAILILFMSVGAQLSGPYIGKIIIDQHIRGIVDYAWFELEVSEVHKETPHTIFQDKVYIRSDRIHSEDISPLWREMYITHQDKHYYISTTGAEAVQLTAEEVLEFFKDDIRPVIQLASLYVLILIAGSFLAFSQSYLLQSISLRIIQKMRSDIMKHVHRLPVRYFDNTPVGQIVTRITNDTEAIKELFMSFMATFIVSGAHLIGIYVLLFFLDYKLALLCLLILPLFYTIMFLHLKYSKGYVQIMRARLSDMNAMLNEAINVMPIIKAFRREKATIEEFEQLNQERYVNNMKQFRLWAMSSRNISSFIGSITTALVVWYFAGQSLHTAISFGVLYAFIDYLARIFEPMIAIFDQLMNAQRAVVSAERFFDLLDEVGVSEYEATHLPRPQGHVSFEHVTFAYNDQDDVLRNISFTARQGETIALVGHTGSGKSSIMNLLLGFYEPSQGTIKIDGVDMKQLSPKALRKHMGIVLQDPFLFAGDIKFNVSLYNEEIDEDQIKQALREVGAEAFVLNLPQGYNEAVTERGSTFSAGQRQLISFARALAFNPAILILDEATSSVDSETEEIIQKALQVLVEGRTTFVIAHRLSTIRQADLILVLEQGEIIERGTHDELMALGGHYCDMIQLQQEDQDITA